MIAANVMQEKMTAIFGELYNKIKVKQNAISAAHTNIAQQSLAMRDVLACDGQEMKATARRLPNDERQTAFQITSIVSYNTGMTLGQVIHHKRIRKKQQYWNCLNRLTLKAPSSPGTLSIQLLHL